MKFIWAESARAEVRAIDREAAIRILHALAEYGNSGASDIKAQACQWQGLFRIRVGDYRVIFAIAADEITVVRVGRRSDIYR